MSLRTIQQKGRLMIVQRPGYVHDDILLLGSRSINSYLIKGEQYALLGGGVPWVVARLEAQLDEFDIDRERIRYLVISHAHHDHCGAVPYLLKKYPHLEVVCSSVCASVLNDDKQVELIKQVCRKTLDALKRPHVFDGLPLDFCAVPVAREVGDGDRIDLGGGLSLQFFETPGHSRCSLSAYVPEIAGLFPADAVPSPESDKRVLTVTANNDYGDYIRSLEKLADLPVRLVGYEHGGVLTEEDAEGIIARGLEATLEQRRRIHERYEELKDLESLIEEVTDKYRKLELFSLVPAGLLRAITGRMVKSALGRV